MLKYLSGIENESDAAINGWFDDALKSVQKKFQSVVKNVQNFASNLPKITKNIDLQKFGQKLKRIGATPARAAFLTLVRLNVVKTADRIADAYRTNPTKVKDFWVKGFGGNWESLKKVINKGTKKAKINGTLGAVDPATLSMIAAALPIIAAFVALLKQIRGNKDAADAVGDQALINDMAGYIDENPTDQINQQAGGGGGFDQKTLLLAGGAAVAIYLFTRKK